jgi:NADPH:quinone reductase-like Zn-dependent oxidoreductase
VKEWQFHRSSQAAHLSMAEVAVPEPQPGELLIQVCAAGVTPTELLWSTTTHHKSGEPRTAAVPGHEFSGIVAAVGAGGEPSFSVGQQVFGMNDWYADGATAEFCCTRPSDVVLKPHQLTHVEAASVPIGGLTAWQGLFDRAGLKPGERVLIHGGSGAVGVLAIQLASQRGAEVLTTASARNKDFLAELGAQLVIDYRTERFEQIVGEVDVVFDAVGGQTLAQSWGVLGPRGRLVTIAADSEATKEQRTKDAYFIVQPNQPQLGSIAGQLASGLLRPVVKSVLPFDQADRAYFPNPADRHGCGKTVVSVSPQV